MMRRSWLLLIPAAALAGAVVVPAAGADTGTTIYACVGGGRFTHVNTAAPQPCPSQTPVSWPVTAGGVPSPSPSATVPAPSPTAPSPSPTAPSPSPTAPSPSPTTPGPANCTAALGNFCGPYAYPPDPFSQAGWSLYVGPQDVGSNPGTTAQAQVTDPGNWSATVNAVPYGNGSVQVYPSMQQQTNDWCTPPAPPGSCGSPTTDTPISGLASLSVNYSETSPRDAGSMYEFGADAWTSYAANNTGDIMFWADTSGRCNPGSYGGTVLGTAAFDGQTWTVNRYGGPGAEIIFVLDSDPGTPNSCATQSSGSIDVLAGLNWLINHGYAPATLTMSMLNTGWEVTSADNTTFTVNSYSITAVPS